MNLDCSAQRVDLSTLETPALERYCAAYGLLSPTVTSRLDLLDAATHHFANKRVEESDVLRSVMVFAGSRGGRW
jgi:hypothetical protein